MFIQYGTGSMNGTVGYDQVNLGGLNVAGQGIGVATQVADFLSKMPFDGIFGLAYISLAEDKIPTWFQNAYKEKLIPREIYSFYLSNNAGTDDSRMIIGSPDPKYYQGEISWNPLLPIGSGSTAEEYFNIGFKGIKVGDKAVSLACTEKDACEAIVDTGTSMIVAPLVDYMALAGSIGTVEKDCSNVSELPNIVLDTKTGSYEIDPQHYVIKVPDDNGKLVCMLGIEPSLMQWILGDVFFRAYYSVFDMSGDQVGFAKVADKAAAKEPVAEYGISQSELEQKVQAVKDAFVSGVFIE